MSDGVALDQLDAVTGSRLLSGALGMNAGVDMGLWDTAFSLLEEAVERGLVSEKRIDEAAGRVLELKFRRGLFEEPLRGRGGALAGLRLAGELPQPERLAEQTPVLLKNSGNLLPLTGGGRRILLTGRRPTTSTPSWGDYTPRRGRAAAPPSTRPWSAWPASGGTR